MILREEIAKDCIYYMEGRNSERKRILKLIDKKMPHTYLYWSSEEYFKGYKDALNELREEILEGEKEKKK